MVKEAKLLDVIIHCAKNVGTMRKEMDNKGNITTEVEKETDNIASNIISWVINGSDDFWKKQPKSSDNKEF